MQKKLLLLFILTCIPAYGTQMCVEDDTVAVVLDASQNGTNTTTNELSSAGANAGEWDVTFAWGRVYGIAACLSQNYGLATYGVARTDELIDNDAVVVGGEQNGGYCFCRLTHPAVSRWAYRYNSGSLAACAGNCVSACAYYQNGYTGFRHVLQFRRNVFGSIGM